MVVVVVVVVEEEEEEEEEAVGENARAWSQEAKAAPRMVKMV